MSTPRLPLQDRTNLQNNLQIRVVPYSPPRLSSDYSTATQLDIDSCSSSSGLPQANVQVYQSDTPQTQRQPADSSPVLSSPISPLGQYSRSPYQDTYGRRASTPRRPSTSSSNRRLKHLVNVHADKTFSLLPQVECESSSQYSSSALDSTLPSTFGRNSSVTFSHGRRSSILALQQQESAPTSPDDKTPPRPTANKVASTSSPWNYEFVGGLRKVYQQTPASDLDQSFSPIATPSKAHLPPPGTTRSFARATSMHIPRKPLPSSYAESPASLCSLNVRTIEKTLSTKPNVHAQPSLESILLLPSSDQNYRILGDSGSSDYSLSTQSRPRTEESEPNYVKLDGAPSPPVAGTPASRLKSEYSRESLIVAPLNPARKLFTDKSVSVKLSQGRSSPRFLATWSAVMKPDAARALFGSRIYPPRSRNARAPSQVGSSTVTPGAHQSPKSPLLIKKLANVLSHDISRRHARHSTGRRPLLQKEEKWNPIQAIASSDIKMNMVMHGQAWMIAAFIPLPTNRHLEEKNLQSTSHIDLAEDNGASPSQLAKEIALFNRAKWWRDLNRAMAVIGLLIIGAFAVLIALGVQQRWR
ncbi:hypothetical protein MY4038_006788 [Beauveria bassiana]